MSCIFPSSLNFETWFYWNLLLQSGSKLLIPKSGKKIFPPVKLLCYLSPRCGSLTFIAINRTAGLV